LRDHVDVFKVGMELFTAEGPGVVQQLKDLGCRVFLDLKLHDIPNTVAKAVRNVSQLGVDFIDIHAAGGLGMMRAAREAAEEGAAAAGFTKRPRLLAITVLTSLDASALAELGIDAHPLSLVMRWASLAKEAGINGVVCSLQEVQDVRRACGREFLTVTPGVRPTEGGLGDDQRRVGTPRDAVNRGSSAIVVGRPIIQAADPVGAAAHIRQELRSAEGDMG
jgi:orotidine-5'-phosphate decarboxylase